MDLELNGRRALITGASAGLGKACAAALAAEGVELVIASRDEARIAASAKDITKIAKAKVRYFAADVAKRDDVARLLEFAGPIDILVSNAGGPPPGLMLDHPPEKWDEAERLVLDSAISLTRGVLPGMVERKWGRLVYITSIGSLQPIPDLILSNTFRAGVTAFMKSVSNSYAGQGITANCVCPGYTATERLRSLAEKRAKASGKTTDETYADFVAGVPAGRLGKPEELAALVAFLVSDRAAYITGCSIPVDGGLRKSLI